MGEPPVFEMPKQPVVVEFKGGFKDGEVLRSDSADQNEVTEVAVYYFGSDSGTVGKRFRSLSNYGMKEIQEKSVKTPDGLQIHGLMSPLASHLYEITERVESDQEIKLVFTYQGVET